MPVVLDEQAVSGTTTTSGIAGAPLHPRQADAFMSPATELLYGGAKFGGKSYLMRYAFIEWCRAIRGLQIYFFRKHYKELIENHMEGPTGFRAWLQEDEKKRLVAVTTKEIRFANGSRISLNHMQDERFLQQWQGVDIHVLGIDQCEQFLETTYRFLRAQVRINDALKRVIPASLQGLFPRILLSANPGGVGHKWVKDMFIGKPKDNRAWRLYREERFGLLRQFIPARAEDNPSLRADPGYISRLESIGNPMLVRALREGDWEVVVDSMFGYLWREHRHVCDSFPIPVTWEIWRGCDDGFASPLSCHWITRDPDDGTFFVIAEIYQKGLLPEDAAEKICARDLSIPLDFGQDDIEDNDLPLAGDMDSAAFAMTGTGRQSRGDQMNLHGCKFRRVEKPSNSRVMRVQMMHQMLSENPNSKRRDRDGKRMPRMIFFRNCAHAIETIPALQIDKDNPEDVDTDSEDHAFDSVTYGLLHKKKLLKLKDVIV